jgi:hypothetical protein
MNKLILPFQTVEVNSTAISTAQYEYDNYRLTLTFNNGVDYEYNDVPNFVFEGLRTSASKGKFINKHILSSYKYKRA